MSYSLKTPESPAMAAYLQAKAYAEEAWLEAVDDTRDGVKALFKAALERLLATAWAEAMGESVVGVHGVTAVECASQVPSKFMEEGSLYDALGAWYDDWHVQLSAVESLTSERDLANARAEEWKKEGAENLAIMRKLTSTQTNEIGELQASEIALKAIISEMEEDVDSLTLKHQEAAAQRDGALADVRRIASERDALTAQVSRLKSQAQKAASRDAYVKALESALQQLIAPGKVYHETACEVIAALQSERDALTARVSELETRAAHCPDCGLEWRCHHRES